MGHQDRYNISGSIGIDGSRCQDEYKTSFIGIDGSRPRDEYNISGFVGINGSGFIKLCFGHSSLGCYHWCHHDEAFWLHLNYLECLGFRVHLVPSRMLVSDSIYREFESFFRL